MTPMRQWPCHWVALAAALAVAAVPAATLAETHRAATEAARDADTTPASGATALDGFYLRAGFVADGSKPTRFKERRLFQHVSRGSLRLRGRRRRRTFELPGRFRNQGRHRPRARLRGGAGPAARSRAPAPPALLLRRPRQFSPNHRQAGCVGEAVHRDRYACRLRGPAGPRATAGGALEPVRWRRRRPFPHPHRRDAHGVPTDEDHRSGRPANRFRMDGHGGGRSVFGGTKWRLIWLGAIRTTAPSRPARQRAGSNTGTGGRRFRSLSLEPGPLCGAMVGSCPCATHSESVVSAVPAAAKRSATMPAR